MKTQTMEAFALAMCRAKEENEKLLDLLDRNTSPTYPSDYDTGECYYCDIGIADPDDMDAICDIADQLERVSNHRPTCHWRLAREAVEKAREVVK